MNRWMLLTALLLVAGAASAMAANAASPAANPPSRETCTLGGPDSPPDPHSKGPHHHGRFRGPPPGPPLPGMGPGDWDKLEAMTPQERGAHFEKLYQEGKAMREKMKSMTPEERRAFFEKRMQEKLASLPPDVRKKMEEHRAKRGPKGPPPGPDGRAGRRGPGEEMFRKLEAMTPAERAAHFERFYQQGKAMREKFKNMTPEERRAFFEKHRRERFDDLTPEQRKKMEERHQKRRERFESLTPGTK